MKLKESEIEEIVNTLDKDGNGEISYSEFAVSQQIGYTDKEKELFDTVQAQPNISKP